VTIVEGATRLLGNVSVSGFDADPARLTANLGRLGEEANVQRVVLEACEIVREIAISDAGILIDSISNALNRLPCARTSRRSSTAPPPNKTRSGW
jgi:hypothetical protein